MTQPEQERITPAEFLMIQSLCQWHNDIPGPIAWFCRYAWLAYSTTGELDVDQAIIDHGAWLNRPENAGLRANLVSCIEFLQRMAAKQPLWELPIEDNPFDPSEWLGPQWQLTEGTWTIPGGNPGLTVPVELWHAPTPNEPERRVMVAKWNGRPIPGKCTVESCDNQATSMSGHWDGGAPGQGAWHQTGRCPLHPYQPSGLDELHPDTTHNPEV